VKAGGVFFSLSLVSFDITFFGRTSSPKNLSSDYSFRNALGFMVRSHYLFALVLLSRWFIISILFGYDYVLFNIYQSCCGRPNDACVHLSSGWEFRDAQPSSMRFFY